MGGADKLEDYLGQAKHNIFLFVTSVACGAVLSTTRRQLFVGETSKRDLPEKLSQ
jgi:hypothetical protein